MNLKLNKSICFFDLETTGLNIATDRIIEIAILKINPDGTEELKSRRINPQMPISKEATELTGISNEDVANEPTFEKIANSLAQFIGDSDLAGYNSNKFDTPVLIEEFARAGIDFPMENRRSIDVQTIFFKKEPRNLAGALKFYCNEILEGAHCAKNDIEATKKIFFSQLDRYKNDENDPILADVDYLHEYSKQKNIVDYAGTMIFDQDGKEIWNIGKHKGKLVEKYLEYDRNYPDWVLGANFTSDTKNKLKKIIQRVKDNQSRHEINPNISDIDNLKNKFNSK